MFIDADENLFRKVLRNSHHTLYPLLTPPNIQPAPTKAQQKPIYIYIITKKSAVSENNFIIRCCTEIYTNRHAVLMFALFFLNVFSLLALTFVAVSSLYLVQYITVML